nr:MAG TPA: hypothetical protein [Caudoviricetes sp.]
MPSSKDACDAPAQFRYACQPTSLSSKSNPLG